MKILVLGAGKSATSLINYLLDKSTTYNWQITVGDLNIGAAKHKIDGHANGRAISFDVFSETDNDKHVAKNDIIVSLLPPAFHDKVAPYCVKHKKHMVTASYLSPTIKAMDADFKANGKVFMGEIGLDPGIDHLAIMDMVDRIKAKGGKLSRLGSYTGALIAPESDTNPWHYKFSWAPMNVVKAGQGISQYLHEEKVKYIPYNRLFTTYLERNVEGTGQFEIYPNRNSMEYIEKYDLHGIATFLRGTMRYKGYCDGWNSFVKLGWTNDSYQIPVPATYTDLLRSYLPIKYLEGNDIKTATANFLGIAINSQPIQQLDWLGLFDNVAINIDKATETPARVLCHLLSGKWVLEPTDKDLIVMIHEMTYELDGKKHQLDATLVCKGNDSEDTAISQTVGLPLGMMVKLIATGEFDKAGVNMPLAKKVYAPILKELQEYGIAFEEVEREIT